MVAGPSPAQKVTLRQGDTSSDIATIRTHLIIEGDLGAGSGSNPTFDREFLDGLSRFQIRNGLRVSGFVDQRTLAALNVTANERLQQLETNLKRVQGLMSFNKAPRYVLVNVPFFVAQGVQNGELSFDSNVVAGKPARATPQVSAKIVEINFFPTWSVPEIVAQQDLIPKIRKDPSYFSEEHFTVMRDWKSPPLDPASVDWDSPQVVSYKFRQEPGTFNALGVVRINMPNKYSVYMHDTPLKQLFGQSARAFSSGCVRVEKVQELVAWLLSAQNGWTLDKVQAQIDSGKKLDVKLATPVPVHFVYLTAFATGTGLAQFRPDIYGRDSSFGDPGRPARRGRCATEPRRHALIRTRAANQPSGAGLPWPGGNSDPCRSVVRHFRAGDTAAQDRPRPACIKRVTIAWDSPMRLERLNAASRNHQERPGENAVRAHQAAHR